ncbi:MAG TPA: glucose-6-phosphate isomerase [Polyangia bacterium]|nr:glucose-6-phosphate isomerase [Polyangia bacterium]
MSRALWNRYREYLDVHESIGLRVDVSRMRFDDRFFGDMTLPMRMAFHRMDELEHGMIANPDENRMVGHYWLRDASRAPDEEIKRAIVDTVAAIKKFAAEVHEGRVRGAAGRFSHLLVIGIGGSALGPELVAAALGTTRDPLHPHFIDNTDPDGIDRTLAVLDGKLGETLTVVISKSGGTKETRNGMLETAAAYRRAKLDFAKHAVAVTGAGSELDQHAKSSGWIARFPMWDWVGGRTSELSAVGLLPAALQGLDIDAMLAGARATDEITRVHDVRHNPSALLALMWYFAGEGKGRKDMVVLPYKDRLELFSRYLQQLVMESLGKEKDLEGKVVHQGIAVYGNKGSTDQHAYVQQLREGVNNFFVTFIEVLRDRDGESLDLEGGATAGDYLSGFLQGTRRALYENQRDSITITIDQVNARSLGVLIALYERAVGFYASLVNINAYHQPGVEAGKKAASAVLALQGQVLALLEASHGEALHVEAIAEKIGAPDEAETIFKILEHAAANPDHGVKRIAGKTVFDAAYAR